MEEIEDIGDIYDFLGIALDATEKEINTAYKKLSLACHPDKNPDDPNAAKKFEKLTRAKEFLLNPSKRHAYDEKAKAEESRNRRYKEMDAKNQKLRADLERREKEAANARASDKSVRKPSTKLKEDYQRVMAERSQRNLERKEDLNNKLRTSMARHVKVTVLFKSNVHTSMAVAFRLQEMLEPFGLLKTAVEEYSAELTFESREQALEATILLKQEKEKLGFLRKVFLQDNPDATNKKTPEETLEELEKMAENLPRRPRHGPKTDERRDDDNPAQSTERSPSLKRFRKEPESSVPSGLSQLDAMEAELEAMLS